VPAHVQQAAVDNAGEIIAGRREGGGKAIPSSARRAAIMERERTPATNGAVPIDQAGTVGSEALTNLCRQRRGRVGRSRIQRCQDLPR
jgi:hypothetical protein